MAYASKYYDPKKAHEYYIQTRELKGYENRYGGSRGDGTSAASDPGYLSEVQKEKQKNLINRKIGSKIGKLTNKLSKINSDESKKKLDKRTDKEISSVKKEIKKLQNSLKNMSPADRARNREAIQKKIATLRSKIKNIRYKKQESYDKIAAKTRSNKMAKKDAIQRLKQQTKGGSTSGFNEKGKAAAAYIKKEMEHERDELTKKTNDELDSKMLKDVSAFADHIKRLRENGGSYSNGNLLKQFHSISKRISKTKKEIANHNKKAFVSKYKDEIDKLRADDSMFSYWDNRKKSDEKFSNSQKLKKKMRDIRYGKTKTTKKKSRKKVNGVSGKIKKSSNSSLVTGIIGKSKALRK